MFNKNNNYLNFPKLVDGDFKILACFSRSFDEHHEGRVHLISSTVLCNYRFSYDVASKYYLNLFHQTEDDPNDYPIDIINDLRTDDSRNFKNNKILTIIEVVNDDFELDLDNYTKNILMQYKYDYKMYRPLKVIKIPFSLLMGVVTGKNIHIDETILNNLFGEINDSKKNLDLLGNNTLFIFSNIS